MIGHENIPEEGKLVAAADLAQNLRSEVSCVGGAEQGSALVAAEGDEMEITLADKPFKPLRYGNCENIEERPTL